MKVVLFCGGLGMRLKEYADKIPKPMIPIGYRPFIWNIMKYDAHYGHKDFILCRGHQADTIKNYITNYDETISNDFIFTKGGENIKLMNADIEDWGITFVDTKVNSNIGMRLMQLKEHFKGEEMFLSNYSDELTNFVLSSMINWFTGQMEKTAALAAYQSAQSNQVVQREKDGLVKSISHIGYFPICDM
jgi:glucose-1-phosphate cytidylyltransferase